MLHIPSLSLAQSLPSLHSLTPIDTSSYYRHFKLYRVVLGRAPKLVLRQSSVGQIAPARDRRPLTDAVKLQSGEADAAPPPVELTEDEQERVEAEVEARLASGALACVKGAMDA